MEGIFILGLVEIVICSDFVCYGVLGGFVIIV